jgi:hypothetical protein
MRLKLLNPVLSHMISLRGRNIFVDFLMNTVQRTWLSGSHCPFLPLINGKAIIFKLYKTLDICWLIGNICMP